MLICIVFMFFDKIFRARFAILVIHLPCEFECSASHDTIECRF